MGETPFDDLSLMNSSHRTYNFDQYKKNGIKKRARKNIDYVMQTNAKVKVIARGDAFN